MPRQTEIGDMVKYQFEIDDEKWEQWKNTVPRSKSLEARIIELIEADTLGRVREESVSSAHDPQGEQGGDREEQPSETDKSPPQPHAAGAVREEAEHALRELGLPGNGSKYETRIEAVLSFYDYLREHAGERVSKEDLRDLADEADIDTGYSSFGSLWSNWVKKNKSQGRPQNTLTRLPGVEMDGDDYVYTGGGDV